MHLRLKVIVSLATAVLAVAAAGCGGSSTMMPTPGAATGTPAYATRAASPVEMPTASVATPAASAHSTEVPGAVLTILSPKDGDTIALPAPIHYKITGFEVGASGGHLQVIVAGIEGTQPVEIPLDAPAGVAQLPDVKFLTGQRDLTFELVNADGSPVPGDAARITIHRLLITGRR